MDLLEIIKHSDVYNLRDRDTLEASVWNTITNYVVSDGETRDIGKLSIPVSKFLAYLYVEYYDLLFVVYYDEIPAEYRNVSIKDMYHFTAVQGQANTLFNMHQTNSVRYIEIKGDKYSLMIKPDVALLTLHRDYKLKRLSLEQIKHIKIYNTLGTTEEDDLAQVMKDINQTGRNLLAHMYIDDITFDTLQEACIVEITYNGDHLLEATFNKNYYKYEPITTTNKENTMNNKEIKTKDLYVYNLGLDTFTNELTSGYAKVKYNFVSVENVYAEYDKWLAVVINTDKLPSYMSLDQAITYIKTSAYANKLVDFYNNKVAAAAAKVEKEKKAKELADKAAKDKAERLKTYLLLDKEFGKTVHTK